MDRILRGGRVVPELEEPVTLEVRTKCPAKWVLIDLETGEAFTPYENINLGRHWKPITPE
jgi:hypothetical protein